MELIYPGLDEFLRMALDEDIGTGDVTTNCCVPENAVSTGMFSAKEAGVISGLGVAARVFELLDDTVRISPLVKDGDAVNAGDAIAGISGPSRAILTGERLALNLLQHMSAIATRTAEAVREVSHTNTKIKDTRKTTPGLRMLEKYAVRCGGGTNHRFNLADGVLIKDNHIKAAGGITNAVKHVRDAAEKAVSPPHHKALIEVETESLEQVEEALDAGADIIMLDNMSPELMSEAVKLINGRSLTEASGNMGDRDLKIIAETGVDFISIGALTHSVKALDISLKFK
jgi:nicotinate-nucleotide pyrophosphorylase (carboxylating)